jgi:hypothetical protein
MSHFLCYHYDFSYLHHTTMFKTREKNLHFANCKAFEQYYQKHQDQKNLKNEHIHVCRNQIHIKFTTMPW